MSVVGFDFGNESCIVAVARQRRIDVVLNDESKHETPAIVCFDGKQRFNGTAGAASTMMNPKISITQIKRLIGRQFSDPDFQSDLKSFPFTVTEGPDGYPLIHACYLGENRTFTPTQILGMVLSDLKGIAEKNLNAAVVDCCIGIPVYFTDFQRRAVLDAATIAGLHPLRLIHETTATALAYGFYKTDLPENGQLNVAFVDIGHASMQVCISGFKKGQLKILSHAYDRCLGVRDFDEALFQHFASKFKEEYKIDVLQNSEACLRLRAGCEKLKKVLSANTEALLHIECLMDERDVQCFIKRDEFEQICVPILEQAKRPLEKALADAGLTIENVHMVEMVGSSSRVPTIIKILTDFFKKEPRRTMNASEFVARGCALECAILSPNFKVCDFQVNESFPFSIALLWKGSAPDAQNGAAENQKSTIVFPIGSRIPSVKALNFYRSRTFSIDVQYADVSELQAPAKISTYTIGPFRSTTGERSKLKVKARLNLHGIVSLESATLFEEEKVEVPVSKVTPQEANKMENNEPSSDALPPSSSKTDVNMQDAKGTADASGAENVVPESGDRPVQMETDNKSEAPKNKVKKTNIPMAELVYGGMIHADVQKTVEKEFEMALQDRVMVETKDKKNAVESYVYNLRNKLNDKYYNFVTASERDEFLAKLQEVEDWLYEDGEDNTKGVYIAKLEELKKQGDPIVERFKESIERGTVIDQLMYCINSYREAAMSNDAKFNHIDRSEKQKVITECATAEQWLREKKQQQDSLPKYATPVLTLAEIRKKAEALDSICRLIMTKPKPAPAKPAPETPPTPPTQCGEQQQPQGEDPNASPKNADANPESGDKPVQIETDNKNFGSLDSIEPTKFILEKEQSVSDSSILTEIDRTMKKHVDNLLHVLGGVSAWLTQLESRTRHLENSVDDLKISVGNNHESTDGKMKQLENILRERDGENDCEFFQWIDGSSIVMDAQQLEEMNKKLEELDTRISLLDEVVSEKLEAIEGRVADFGEKVMVIEQRVEQMVDEMEINEVKHYGWKHWMVAVVVFLWCLVNFGSY